MFPLIKQSPLLDSGLHLTACCRWSSWGGGTVAKTNGKHNGDWFACDTCAVVCMELQLGQEM